MAGIAPVGHRRLRVPDPHGHASEEPVALAHREQGVERTAIEQAEIAGVVLQLHLRELVEQGVEPARGRQFEARLALTLLAYRVHHVAPGAPVIEHPRDQLRRILKVGIEHHDRLTLSMVEPGGERGLMAEVAREENQAHARVARGEPVQGRGGAVGGAVVDEHQLEVQPLQRATHPPVELVDRRLLVVDGRDDAEQLDAARTAVVFRRDAHGVMVGPARSHPQQRAAVREVADQLDDLDDRCHHQRDAPQALAGAERHQRN